MDLHALTRQLGIEVVATSLGCSVRCLEDLRRGHTALTVDDLFQLERHYPAFDPIATIRRIGARRDKGGRSRKARNAND